jgi:diadenosine tetraphosphate (Ap4A) HIT family hydrolase
MTQLDSLDADCGVCRKLKNATPDDILFQNELWHVCATDPPTGVPGWVMLITRRHVSGPAAFNDREAASFGPTLRHLQRVLLEVTGALRIYTAAMGESSPHFHAHMVPRYETMPKAAKAWAVFDLQRAAAAHEIETDEVAAIRVAKAYAAALAAVPPPLP